MNARMLIPSKYFSPADFDGEVTVTIDAVEMTELEVEGKKGQASTTETRGSIRLREYSKPWVCNVTNTKCLIAMFGEENIEKAWVGKRVTVYAERVMSFGEWTLGVRIKGSPDITSPVSLRLRLRKKKEQVLTMQPTAPKSNGAAPAKPSPPTTTNAPFAATWKSFKAAGMSDEQQFYSLLRQSTGKAKRSELTPDDVPKFNAMLAALTSPAGVDAEPPPPNDADAPF